MALVVGPAALAAQHHSGSHSYSGHHSRSHSYRYRSYSRDRSSAAVGARDRHGWLERSAEERDFDRQWQSIAEAKAKDRVERRGCR